MRNYRTFAVKAEGKCGDGTSHIWQWRQNVSRSSDLWQSRLSESAEAKLQIFGSPGRDEMRKRNFTSLEVLAELCQSRQSGSAEAELHIFGSQGRTEVWKWNFTFLTVSAERKCGHGTSGLWQLRQSESAEAEHQVFGSQGRAEVWKLNFRSLAVKKERKCSQALWQSSQVGRRS